VDPPTTRIVIFTSADEENLLLDAMRIGVHGYLQKTLSVSEMLTVLRSVQKGEITVKRKMQDIYHKLQVEDQAQAVAEAIHLGLI
jgi:DNA-binding NarL/FixJ family response regulator